MCLFSWQNSERHLKKISGSSAFHQAWRAEQSCLESGQRLVCLPLVTCPLVPCLQHSCDLKRTSTLRPHSQTVVGRILRPSQKPHHLDITPGIVPSLCVGVGSWSWGTVRLPLIWDLPAVDRGERLLLVLRRLAALLWVDHVARTWGQPREWTASSYPQSEENETLSPQTSRTWVLPTANSSFQQGWKEDHEPQKFAALVNTLMPACETLIRRTASIGSTRLTVDLGNHKCTML